MYGPSDEIVSLSGPELLGRLHNNLKATNPMDIALFAGAISSLESLGFGGNLDSVGDYRPGIDSPIDIDIPATIKADGNPKARWLLSDADLLSLAVVADMPERLGRSTGITSLRKLGKYSVALGMASAMNAGAWASLYKADETGADLVFEDTSKESYAAMAALQESRTLLSPETRQSPLAQALEMVSNDVVSTRDVALVISDFLDGYDKENSSFDWQENLERLYADLGDRLLCVRLKSPAQIQMPQFGNGIGLPASSVSRLNSEFASIATGKDRTIEVILEPVRSVTVDAGEGASSPVEQISEFLIGNE